ncbi:MULTISPECIES: hypothetical protein [Bradyrhizobium]|uniref:hypothetical protein n=1 Tax=Bradyrhizobium centrosematis TaxID=1300039 RepID=UPI002169C8A3|nr:hypothetical protein [Bradyrhizobium centrosematis]MCS3765866.1 hypothetical protein [Bradyrhizobium centrosematis]MCS3778232.1 hypothetical protein [Bradyrhizobium centrosematis]
MRALQQAIAVTTGASHSHATGQIVRWFAMKPHFISVPYPKSAAALFRSVFTLGLLPTRNRGKPTPRSIRNSFTHFAALSYQRPGHVQPDQPMPIASSPA